MWLSPYKIWYQVAIIPNYRSLYQVFLCFFLSCVVFPAFDGQRWLGSKQQLVFYYDLLPSTHRCTYLQWKDDIFPFLNSWVTAAFLPTYYFMCLSGYQRYFQNFPSAWRQCKPFCPLNVVNACILIFRTNCFFMVRTYLVVVYDHRILQGLLRVNSRRFRESRWINRNKVRLIGFFTPICFLVWLSTFCASLYKLALQKQYIPFSKQLGDRRLSSQLFFHNSFRVPNVFSRLPPWMTTV